LYSISAEISGDWWEVEALYDLCFAPGREALSSYRLREAAKPVADLCLVARDDLDVLAGAIRFWPIQVAQNPVLLLGPIAVHPTRQAEGLGGILMRESLDRAKRSGWDRVMLVGDEPYYCRFGFQRLEGVTMPPPTNPKRVLGLALTTDAWLKVKGPVEPVAT